MFLPGVRAVSVRSKVLLAVAFAFSGFVIAVVMLVYTQLSAANSVVSTIQMPRLMSAVIHELQIERGRSVVVASSGYSKDNVQALLGQRLPSRFR